MDLFMGGRSSRWCLLQGDVLKELSSSWYPLLNVVFDSIVYIFLVVPTSWMGLVDINDTTFKGCRFSSALHVSFLCEARASINELHMLLVLECIQI